MDQNISEIFQNLKIGEIERIIKQELNQGKDPYYLVKECSEEMERVGKKFENGDYFLAELLISAKMFEKAMGIISPYLKEKWGASQKKIGKIVLGTPKGDVHDLGKNIFSLLANVAGFEVIDLGIDVPPQKFLDIIKQELPEIVGMSALITTTYQSMKEVVDLLKQNGLRDNLKIIIGGGATGEETRRYIGADAQTLDAVEGVRICRGFVTLISHEKGEKV